MTESLPEKTANTNSIVGIVWIALLTAIVVTIIDWKIKQDILRLTDAFYKIYPAILEREGEQAKVSRLVDDSVVLHVRPVDHDPRVEKENVSESLDSETGKPSGAQWGFWEALEGDADSGTADDSGRLSEEPVDLQMGE